MKAFKQFVRDGKLLIHKHFIGKKAPAKDKPVRKKIEEKLSYDRMAELGKAGFEAKHKHLTDHYNNNPHLHPHHHEAVADYTSAMGYVLNEAHYQGKNPHEHMTQTLGSNETHDLNKTDRHLSDAISKSKMTRSFHVFSGMQSPERLKPSHDGRIHIQNPAYTSTSIRPGVARQFAKQVVRGTRGGTRTGSQSSEYSKHMYDVKRKRVTKKAYERIKSMNSVAERAGNLRPMAEPRRYKHVAKIHVPSGSHGIYTAPISRHDHESEYLLHKGAHVSFHPEPTVDHHTQTVIWHGRVEHDGIAPTRHSGSGQ